MTTVNDFSGNYLLSPDFPAGYGQLISNPAQKLTDMKNANLYYMEASLDSDNLRQLRRMRPADGAAHLGLLMDMVPGRAGSSVADPYYGDDAGFDRTWDDVTRAAEAIVAHLSP